MVIRESFILQSANPLFLSTIDESTMKKGNSRYSHISYNDSPEDYNVSIFTKITTKSIKWIFIFTGFRAIKSLLH